MDPKINSFTDLEVFLKPGVRPLILFSGGLDGSYLIKRLLNNKKVDSVVALTIELGGDGDSKTAKQTAISLGAESIVLDKTEMFAKEFVIPALMANARYLNQHPISASLSRPFLTKCAVDLAKKENCNIILHSATNAQNSMRRFNGAMREIGHSFIYGSPFSLSAISRKDKIEYLQGSNIGMLANRKFSFDSNFWCREFEANSLDNVEDIKLPEDLFLWTKNDSTVTNERLFITFEQGVPVAINGISYSFLDLIKKLNYIVGRYKIGRYTSLEEIEGGVKFPEVREMPAASILLDASRYLESAILDAESIRNKLHMEQIWVREAVEGRWYSLLRKAADQFIYAMSSNVTGTICYELSFGQTQLLSMKTNKKLYGVNRDHYEKDLLLQKKVFYQNI